MNEIACGFASHIHIHWHKFCRVRETHIAYCPFTHHKD